jgi:hypothetical protein
LPRKKSLVKKRYKFCHEIEVYTIIDIGLARKRYRFCQEKIEKVGKGLVVSRLGLRFRPRGR